MKAGGMMGEEEYSYTAWITSFVLIHHIIDKKLNSALGITINEYRTLVLMEYSGDEIIGKSLAQKLRLKPSSTSRILEQLEAVESVRLDENARDRRESPYTLTVSGRELLSSAEEIAQRIVAKVWQPILDEELASIIKYSAASVQLNGQIDTGGHGLRGDIAYEMALCNTLDDLTQAAKNSGIPLPELRILLLLNERATHLTPADIAAELFMWPNDVSNRCDNLVKKGFVVRERNPTNKRSVFIGLTESGKEMAKKVCTQIQMDFSKKPGASEAEMHYRCAHKIVEHLKRSGDIANNLRQM